MLRTCKLVDEQRVDALTCGGDLYEQERFTPDTAEFLSSTFAELAPLRVFLAPGNPEPRAECTDARRCRRAVPGRFHVRAALAACEADGGFVASARAAGGRLTLERPFPVDLDLAALATATRYPAPVTDGHCRGPKPFTDSTAPADH